MSDSTEEVRIFISVYIAKKIKDHFEDCCIEYAVGEIKEDDADSAYLRIISKGGLTVPAYLRIISKGGLTVPSYSLSNHVCKAFALLDYFNEIINKSDILARTSFKYTLINMLDSYH